LYGGDERAFFDLFTEPGQTQQSDDGDCVWHNGEEIGIECAEAEVSKSQTQVVGDGSGRDEDDQAKRINLFGLSAVERLGV
jgi:hypothetical protein